MYTKTFLHHLGAALLVLVTGITAAAPLAAQGELSGEEIALLDRAVAALNAANSYTSYAIETSFVWHETWEGQLNGETVSGQTTDLSRTTNEIADFTGPNFNTREQITLSLSSSEQNYALTGEIRDVDGAVYVTATYEDTGPQSLPNGWIKLGDSRDFQVWPGLQMVVNPAVYLSDTPVAITVRTMGIPVDTPETVFRQFATGVTSEAVTLDDGMPAEAITFSLNKEGIRAAGDLFIGDSPIYQIVFDAAQNDPLVVTVLVDENGQLVGLDFSFEITVENVDISAAPDVPAGFLLSVTHTQRFSARFSAINAPVERVAAPETQTGLPPAYNPPTISRDLPWWNDRVFYEIFVRSFYDSNGDGIGDLRGVIEKLDYLNDGNPATTDDLGVTGIWLMPVMQSPSYHGYDVMDYWNIEEDYGTTQDFLDLVAAAHERGIAVIIDMVLNHTSNEHPWFQAALQGDPTYQDFYIWADQPPAYLSPWGSTVWHPGGGRYYYGLFWAGMPDLNYDNPAVTVEMYDVLWYWLDDMGVDGFRLDAIRHLIEDGAVQQNTPETITWLEGFHAFVHSIEPDMLTVGEIWDATQAISPYVPDKVDIAFEFPLASATLNAARVGLSIPLESQLETVLDLYPPGQYATFLTNHDQNRVMSELQGDIDAAKAAASILLTSPGVPFIYYGEEVGMVGEKPDERIRTPMQWDDSLATAGFSAAMPWQRVQTGYKTFNVAAMTDDPGSLLSHYRSLIHLRNAHPALRSNAIQLVTSSDRGIYACLRYAEGEALLVVVNLSREAISGYTLSAPETLLRGDLSADLLLGTGQAAAPAIDKQGGFVDYVPLDTLPPQSTFVIKLQ